MAKGILENSARTALRKGGVLLTITFAMSFAVNVLRLSGPLFMMLVYDRVLTSRSVETLVSLFVMVAVLMIVLGLVDYSRKRIVARFAAQFQERLEHTILGAASQNEMFPAGKSKPAIGLDEADSLRAFFHSGGVIAVMDFIWTPMFVAAIFFLHPLLGFVCLGAMALMLVSVLVRMLFMGGREENANASSKKIGDLKKMVVASSTVVRSQDMSPGFKARWMSAREAGRDNAIALRDWTAWFDQFSSTLVLLARYSVLATGAYLTLNGQLTVGAMVAATFLVARTLMPVSRFTGEIPNMRKALSGWKKLKNTLAGWDATVADPFPAQTGNTRLRLSVSGLSVRSQITGAMILKSVNLEIAPGSMVEIIGSSGKGKTVLAEALVGLRKRSAGSILFDGINIARMSDEEQAKAVGYVPEDAMFIAGSLAENISRLDRDATPEKVAAAARKACLHAWISALPDGYQTEIDTIGSSLSKGQRKQLTLARALYYNPRILIVDEPDEMLLERLPKTIKATFDRILADGGAIVLLARKPLALQQARSQMTLDKGSLGNIRSIPANVGNDDKTVSKKVTVLSDKKAAVGPKTRVRGG